MKITTIAMKGSDGEKIVKHMHVYYEVRFSGPDGQI